MATRITQLTETESGTYTESGDIAPDLMHGEQYACTAEDAAEWLTSDEGYEYATGFAGWGVVLRHTESGQLLSVTED